MKKNNTYFISVILCSFLAFILSNLTYASVSARREIAISKDTIRVLSDPWYHLQSRQNSIDSISVIKSWKKEIGMSLESVLPKEISNACQMVDSGGMVMMQNDTVSNTLWHRVKYKLKVLGHDDYRSGRARLSLIAPIVGLLVVGYVIYAFLMLFVFRKKI